MKPKKLIRSKIIEVLKPGEYEKVEDIVELNNLYCLKVKEELEEIRLSKFKDISEFADLFSVVLSFAFANGFPGEEIVKEAILKNLKKGTFGNLALNNLNPNNPSNALYFKDIC